MSTPSSVSTRYLINGSRDFVIKIDVTGADGGDLSTTKIIDVADMTGAPSSFKIRNISWQFAEFTATLLWDATTDKQAFTLNQYEGDIDFFESTGVPLVNDAGAGKNGNLLITTKDLGAGDTGTIIIRGYH